MGLKRFLSNGCAEVFKGSVHATACGLAGLMFAYNVAAWLVRRERRLATNAVVYGAVILYEVRQTRRHLTPEAPSTAEAGPTLAKPRARQVA